MTQSKKAITIDFATAKDLPTIVNIYNQAIRSGSSTGDTEEFSVEQRLSWFSKYDTDNYPLYVAKIDKMVVGYCSISPYRQGRSAMASVAEISYYIDYNYHRNGVVTSLIKHAIVDCHRIKKEHLLAILLSINSTSIALLEGLNFKKWGKLPNIIDFGDKRCSHLLYGLKIEYPHP